ncbi:unnamed protein product [Leptosia nina]|uniref:Triacylglycerol lipase n=1 Tax=Leptosia nina TaxID=320188 RepID=A0AAV1JC55_9NEOP
MNIRLIVLIFALINVNFVEPVRSNPDEKLTVPAIISRHGYICETHTVVSQGYMLQLHRIPHAKYDNAVPRKTALLQHGLFGNSAHWILNGPRNSLAYVLADAGYHVWMANIRGNRYSKGHAWLQKDSQQYWDFSWHEIAIQDMPAILDYIKGLKSDSEIAYVGHSMGSTILFAMLSSRPEYNSYLESGVALAPMAFIKDIESPIIWLSSTVETVAPVEMRHGRHEFRPAVSSYVSDFVEPCTPEHFRTSSCKDMLFSLCGANERQFNSTLLPVFVNHLDMSTSWKTLQHFAQELDNEGEFQLFDY